MSEECSVAKAGAVSRREIKLSSVLSLREDIESNSHTGKLSVPRYTPGFIHVLDCYTEIMKRKARRRKTCWLVYGNTGNVPASCIKREPSAVYRQHV